MNRLIAGQQMRIKELEAELAEVTESNKAVEKALEGVPYLGIYAEGVEWLKARIVELDSELFRMQLLKTTYMVELDSSKDKCNQLAVQNEGFKQVLKEVLRNNGLDYLEMLAENALALPSNASEIIRKHDAKVVRDISLRLNTFHIDGENT
ncbi:hypothetical protein, partial [Propionivibrio sp.]|uniref:hypothetical protein n=1 Tax=Propionivibrio sp. TaxID=2212460 RepID=UPI003BF445DD